MKYIFKKEIADPEITSGIRIEEIEAQPERWVWGVVYKDQTTLHQFQDDGTFHQFGEIKQDEVEMFVMHKFENRDARIDVIAEGKQIFHFYRNIVLDMLTPEERKVKVYVFGWKDKETGQATYNYILPDDRLVVADHDVDISKFNI